MIQIYYAYTDILLNSNLDSFIEQLPLRTKSKFSLLKRDEDKRLLLTSFVLLSKALTEIHCSEFKLSALQYSATGRPFFSDSPFDFNISHTDTCAAVAFSKDCRVGIDVEKIQEIDFSDFTDYFSREQWEDIYSAKDQYRRFYYYWTLFESGVKADGRGISLFSTKSIKLINSDLFIDNVKWFYSHYDIDRSISCCVTTDKKNNSRKIINITSL